MRPYASKEEQTANRTPKSKLQAKPNVTCAFAGTKWKGGRDTGVPAVVVGVAKKLPREQLGADAIIPSEIDGIITDVVEIGPFRAGGTCTDGTGGGCPPHDEKYRPLIGGISSMRYLYGAGTLGMIVRDSTDGKLVSLTCNHASAMLYDPNYANPSGGSTTVVNTRMMQPSADDGGVEADVYGYVKRAKAMQFGTDSGQNNLVDAAVVNVAPNEAWMSILELHAGPFPFASRDNFYTGIYNVGDQVYKSGRTTGITPPPVATITSKAAAVNATYGEGDNNIAMFTDQILISSATRFCQAGDSGSVIVAIIEDPREWITAYRIIGLFFAGDEAGLWATANHIEDVADLLEIEAWDGKVVVPFSSENTITVNGVQFSKIGNTVNPITHSPD